VPAESPGENVVYLTEERGIQPGPPGRGGTVPPNPHAYEYDGVEQPVRPDPAGPTPIRQRQPSGADPDIEAIRARAAQIAAQLPAADAPVGSHGPLPAQHELVPPPRVDDNPFGDFFGDGPSAWLEEDEHDAVVITKRRVVGTALALGSVLMLVAAWAIWGLAMYRGAGGAEAGGFILLGLLFWSWYLSLPREQQHAFMLRRHQRMQRLIDRRATPLREKTEGSLTMRREKGRYRAMRDERTRRINALGEGAYRAFRQGTLPADLHDGAQRVMAIERQMLSQDQRIHTLEHERRTSGLRGGHGEPEPAAEAPENGHSLH
jgi:hypothetical protein